MTRSFPEGTGAASGSRTKPLKSWAFSDDCLLYEQSVYLEFSIVFGVGDRTLERFLHQQSRFLWTERQQVQGLRCRMPLYFPRHFTCLERRDSRISICRCYLHYFYVGTGRSLLRHLGGMGPMLLEGSGRRKFAQLMPNHIFSHKHRVKNLAVVHQESVTHKIGGYHGSARPGLNRPLGPSGTVHFLDLLDKLYVHEWTFF